MSSVPTANLFDDFEKRRPLYRALEARYIPRNNNGSRKSFFTVQHEQWAKIKRVDREFHEAHRNGLIAEREAIIESLEQAGHHAMADAIRARPAPKEWEQPK